MLLKEYGVKVGKGLERTGVSVGTVKDNMTDNFGDKGKFGIVSAKNVDSTKMLMLKIHDGEGAELVLWCASNLSKMIRAQEVSLAQVLDFDVIMHTNWDKSEGDSAGAEYPLIVLPTAEVTGAEDVTVKTTRKKFVQAPISLADMMNFS